MSMTRDTAIKHFASEKYAGLSIGQAVEKAPPAATRALQLKDIDWIKKHAALDAYQAVQRLFARNLSNPDGVVREVVPRPPVTEAVIHITVPAHLKGKWVNQSQKEGKKLTQWIIDNLEMSIAKNGQA